MANGRDNYRKRDGGRDSGGFIALPWSVMDSPAYAELGYTARALLMEIARQFVRDNNGRLLASRTYMATRGWKSAGVIQEAKKELIEAGFIYETVKGHRPNKASWYAVTWRMLDRHPGYDPGAVEGFERGAYRTKQKPKKAPLSPLSGTDKSSVVPFPGTDKSSSVPENGAMKAVVTMPLVPTDGHHLEKPSAVASH